MIAALLVTAVAALTVVLLVERLASRIGLLDRPNHRSSHAQVRPRGGGLGIVVGTLAGLVVVDLVQAGTSVTPWPLLAAAGVVAAIGLRDDVSSVAPSIRLAVQLAAAVVVVWTYGGFETWPLAPPFDRPAGAAGIVLALLWLVGVTNFFNFMDGADGLAAGQAILTAGAIAFVSWAAGGAVVALLTVAATAAFLVRNWSPARIFLGDVGSGWLGFLLAGLPFAVADGPARATVVVLTATSLALFLVDPAVTLVRRLLRGAPITEAHREHAYQRLIVPGRPHAPVVAGLMLAAASVTAVGLWAFDRSDRAWLSLGWVAVVCAGEWAIAARGSSRTRT